MRIATTQNGKNRGSLTAIDMPEIFEYLSGGDDSHRVHFQTSSFLKHAEVQETGSYKSDSKKNITGKSEDSEFRSKSSKGGSERNTRVWIKLDTQWTNPNIYSLKAGMEYPGNTAQP